MGSSTEGLEMMSDEHRVVSPDIIRLDMRPPNDFEDLVRQAAATLDEAGRIVDREVFVQDLYRREREGSTYMGNGIAIPHTRSAGVLAASVCIYRLAAPMHYVSHGEEGEVDKVFVIAMPEGSGNEHLRVLARLARNLVDKELLSAFDNALRNDEVADLFDGMG